ncbi:hypothetical protein [Escherichia coli]|uniref:hypothetical protein n=1 Tax=Escherichia coli TaxID=562 RepID=UPI001CDC90E1
MSTRLSHPPDMLYMQYVRIIIHFHGGCYVNRITFHTEVDGLPPDACGGFLSSEPVTLLLFSSISHGQPTVFSLEFAQVLDKMAYLTIWQAMKYSAG